MDFELKKQPKKVRIIEGFPGFGLVGTIAIEFLLEHLDAEIIGEFVYDELSPTLAIHKGELVKPMSIWHVKKHNLVILHTILNVQGQEWELAEQVSKLAKKLEATEIITLEGVASPSGDSEAYTFNNKKLEEAGAKPLEESIVVGVSAAMMLRNEKTTPLFAGAHSQLPDSEAAAKIIEVLDNYLGLEVDPKPLRKQAQEFEEKLKAILQQSRQAQEESEKKRLSYLG